MGTWGTSGHWHPRGQAHGGHEAGQQWGQGHHRDGDGSQRWPGARDPTEQQAVVGAGGGVGGGLTQVLEVAQVLEDEDKGGPAEDDAAEGPALQQPREEGPQALGHPRAPPCHVTGLGRPAAPAG